jgi:hypothetical protein
VVERLFPIRPGFGPPLAFHPAGVTPPQDRSRPVFSPQLVTADVDLGVQFVKRVIGVDESKI